jgi:hypothetical protein
MRVAVAAIFVLISAGLAEGQASSDSRSVAPGDYRQHYGVIVDRNIFRRDRRTPPPAADNAAPATAPAEALTPEQSMMLTGLVIEDGHVRAYFENIQTGAIHRVSTGDLLARGQVTQITIDALAYQAEDRVVWVEIGQDLTGGMAAASVAPGAIGAAPSGDVDPATLSLEERMRLRRRQLQN